MSNRRKLDKILGAVKLAENTVSICFDPSLVAEYRKAESGRRVGSLADTAKDAQLEKLKKKIDAATVTFTIRSLGRRRWNELKREHPAREGEKDDVSTGVNSSTFFDALIRESVVDPIMTDEEWETVDASLSEADWNKLAAACQVLNVVSVDLPF